MAPDHTPPNAAELSPRAVSLRQNWDVLPADVVAAIREHTGRIDAVLPAETGYSSHVAATLRTATGSVFVKGLRTEYGSARTQEREALVNPHIVPLGPRVLWRVVTDGWDVLGFEHVSGRIADYGQFSDDLPRVVDLMTALGRLEAPDFELTPVEDRWAAHLARPADAALLVGRTLLHTDWHHTNVLVTPTNTTYLVDWATATRGAPWIDPACWVVWLVHAGHTPQSAERWAAKVPAWSAADDALTVFAGVLARYWQYIADNHPNTMTHRLRDCAARWAAHCGSA